MRAVMAGLPVALPHDIYARTQLMLMREFVDQIKPRAKIDRNGWDGFPLFLQVLTVEPSRLAARIEDRERHVAGLHAHVVHWKNIGGGLERRPLALDVKAAA